MQTREKVHPWVSRWLFIGLVLVFFQVAIGGITRLTDSGLSITEWEVIQGTLPPLSSQAWEDAFAKYQEAAGQQYMALHPDMTMGEFKVIYFWEYFHRLWARMMGLVFLFPFLYFWRKGWIPRWLMRRLGVVILLASAAAAFGWVMVASGLNNENRTWVSAYKLIIHLLIATSLFGYLFWTWLLSLGKKPLKPIPDGLRRLAWITSGMVLVQIVLGGLMAGMRAGLVHPHFPFFVESGPFFAAVGDFSQLNADNLVNYEPSLFIKSWVQVLHRLGAYVLSGLIIWLVVRLGRMPQPGILERARWWLLAILLVQFTLGVLTVVNSIGSIPIALGAIHQVVALLLWISMLFVNHRLSSVRI